ncbi:MAG: hypothetical protein BMS9Abin05_0089 [Rhodothermia bacterium]|nr:MAG: hypothetical protein BMS9Abin05_0089 [Rhodothermia bacterium]
MLSRLHPTLLVFILVVGFTATNPNGTLVAQPDPFSELEVKLGVSKNLSTDRLLESWNSGASAVLEASTPFYAGWTHFGFQFEPFTGRTEDLPSYWSLHARLGWQYRWHADKGINYDSGLRFGLVYMAFDTEDLAGVRNESELVYSLFQNVQVPLSNTLRIYLEGTYSRIMTRTRMNLFYVSTGLIVQLDMPAWLRSVLE